MWGGKPLAILLILSTLSACAAARTSEQAMNGGAPRSDEIGPTADDQAARPSITEVVERDLLQSEQSAAAALAKSRAAYAGEPHYHQEPGPAERYAAEVALLITAQLFVCSFVVVILDGDCSFYASTGYAYY